MVTVAPAEGACSTKARVPRATALLGSHSAPLLPSCPCVVPPVHLLVCHRAPGRLPAPNFDAAAGGSPRRAGQCCAFARCDGRVALPGGVRHVSWGRADPREHLTLRCLSGWLRALLPCATVTRSSRTGCKPGRGGISQVTVALAPAAGGGCSASDSSSIAHVQTCRVYPWRRSGFPHGRGGGAPVAGGLPVPEASGARGWGLGGEALFPSLPCSWCPFSPCSSQLLLSPHCPVTGGTTSCRSVSAEGAEIQTGSSGLLRPREMPLADCARSSCSFMSSFSHFC